jgi:glycosyltransferase involved in cell wall biosynthesis
LLHKPPENPNVLRLGILLDFPQENWASMDLAGEMLGAHLRGRSDVHATMLCPPWRRLTSAIPAIGETALARNIDRYLNRMFLYPRFVRSVAPTHDFFHIVDHSYAHLASALPAGRTGAYCHDLDTFRCLIEPTIQPRSRAFKQMTGRILEGLRRCAVVFHSTEEVRRQLLQHGLVEGSKLVKAPLGVAWEFSPVDSESATTRGDYILHVGSCIARKRIDVLLRAFAEVRRTMPDVRLVQAGGSFAREHQAILDQSGLRGSVKQVRGLSRAELAELYRHARMVVITSDAEGFGLPLVEALACGTPVITTDIPVLQEVGGDATWTFRAGNSNDLALKIVEGLRNPDRLPTRAHRLRRAAVFSWAEHARVIAETYRAISLRNVATPRPKAVT